MECPILPCKYRWRNYSALEASASSYSVASLGCGDGVDPDAQGALISDVKKKKKKALQRQDKGKPTG